MRVNHSHNTIFQEVLKLRIDTSLAIQWFTPAFLSSSSLQENCLIFPDLRNLRAHMAQFKSFISIESEHGLNLLSAVHLDYNHFDLIFFGIFRKSSSFDEYSQFGELVVHFFNES